MSLGCRTKYPLATPLPPYRVSHTQDRSGTFCSGCFRSIRWLSVWKTILFLLWFYTIQYNAMQCNAMQCNAMQCNAMQCNAMQCNAMQCNAMQYTIHNTIQYNTIQYNTIQYNTIQYNTIQYTKQSLFIAKHLANSYFTGFPREIQKNI